MVFAPDGLALPPVFSAGFAGGAGRLDSFPFFVLEVGTFGAAGGDDFPAGFSGDPFWDRLAVVMAAADGSLAALLPDFVAVVLVWLFDGFKGCSPEALKRASPAPAAAGAFTFDVVFETVFGLAGLRLVTASVLDGGAVFTAGFFVAAALEATLAGVLTVFALPGAPADGFVWVDFFEVDGLPVFGAAVFDVGFAAGAVGWPEVFSAVVMARRCDVDFPGDVLSCILRVATDFPPSSVFRLPLSATAFGAVSTLR